MRLIHAIPVDKQMLYRCRVITQSLNKQISQDTFVMVLDLLQDPNRKIPRVLLDIMKDILSQRLMTHKEPNSESTKERPKVFAKILYHNKGMEMIGLNKIMHESQDTIPKSFKNRETPCILYTRTKSIRSKILNYRKTIDEIKIEEWKGRPYTCDCKKFKIL